MTDWFRSESWDPEEFERRLARARVGSRPQYLRIQGLTLLSTCRKELRPAAIQLLTRLYDDQSEHASFERPTAPEFLAEAHEADGNFERAAKLYLEAIDRQRAGNNHGNPEFKLAAMVLRENLSSYYRHTFEMLTSPDLDQRAFLDWHRFEHAKSVAMLADRLGEPATAAEFADRALSLAATRTEPQFSRHDGRSHPYR